MTKSIKQLHQLCFTFNKLASSSNIIIDIHSYSSWLKKESEKLADYIENKQIELKNFNYNRKEIQNELLDIQLPQNEIDNFLNAVDNKDIDKVSEFIHKLLINRNNYPNFSYDLFHKLTLIEDMLSNEQNEDFDINQYVEQTLASYQPIINETIQNMQKIKSLIEQAIKRISEWNGSTITITAPGLGKDYESIEAQTDAEIQVGNNKYCSFVIFKDDDKIIIEDILEAGDLTEDEEFFSTSEAKMDYFNLISELQNPSSATTNKQKIITLYTARPTKDRKQYINATEIPPNLFFTNNLSSAEGIAVDLAGGFGDKRRDIWKVRINKKFLVETLNAGNEKQYQAIGTKPIPIETIVLISEGE